MKRIRLQELIDQVCAAEQAVATEIGSTHEKITNTPDGALKIAAVLMAHAPDLDWTMNGGGTPDLVFTPWVRLES